MKYFLDTSFILALVLDADSNHEKALKLLYLFDEDCYINNNVLNEVLTLIGRKLNISAAREVYYGLIDTFTILNEYDIANYNNLWGQGLEEPEIVIKDIIVTKDNIKLMSPDKSTTLKIILPNGVECIKHYSS